MVGSSGDFSVSTTSDGGTATLTLAGELDMMTAPEVGAELIHAIDNFEHVVVDIGALDFVDSSGLATLLAARVQELLVDETRDAGIHVDLAPKHGQGIDLAAGLERLRVARHDPVGPGHAPHKEEES